VRYSTLSSKEFRLIYNRGAKVVRKSFVLFALSDKDFKVGFVASKKIGNAVARNRAKRVLREIVRLNQRYLKSNYHIILLARSAILHSSFQYINADFLQALKLVYKNDTK